MNLYLQTEKHCEIIPEHKTENLNYRIAQTQTQYQNNFIIIQLYSNTLYCNAGFTVYTSLHLSVYTLYCNYGFTVLQQNAWIRK
jgi:hypothetical protein